MNCYTCFDKTLKGFTPENCSAFLLYFCHFLQDSARIVQSVTVLIILDRKLRWNFFNWHHIIQYAMATYLQRYFQNPGVFTSYTHADQEMLWSFKWDNQEHTRCLSYINNVRGSTQLWTLQAPNKLSKWSAHGMYTNHSITRLICIWRHSFYFFHTLPCHTLGIGNHQFKCRW